MNKLRDVAHSEFGNFQTRLALANVLMRFIPLYTGGRLRAQLLRLAGFRIGPGTTVWGAPTLVGQGDLTRRCYIGENVFISMGCTFDLADNITVDDGATLGFEVMLVTGAHSIGPETRRAGEVTPKPVHIGAGAWLGARCTILPGITIGQGAVAAAGSIVTKNVMPNTLVAGVPAKTLRLLPSPCRLTDLDEHI